jgi:hypothetical protein
LVVDQEAQPSNTLGPLDCSSQQGIEFSEFSRKYLRVSRKILEGKFRKILEGKTDSGSTRNINKFAENLDIIISGEQSKFLNSMWTKNYFSNQDRTFFFKLYNNTLGYNNAVAHFVQGHTPYCSFCDLTRSPDQNNETPLHLFFECRSVCDVLETVLKTVTHSLRLLIN